MFHRWCSSVDTSLSGAVSFIMQHLKTPEAFLLSYWHCLCGLGCVWLLA